MKRTILLILALILVLSGCGKEETPEPTTSSQTQTTTTTEAPPVTEPEPEPQEPYAQFYVADSAMEQATNGAVKEYAVGECYDVRSFGEGVLLFYGDEDTVLTYATSDGEKISTTIEGQSLFGDEMTVLAGNRLAYYHLDRRAVVILDSLLEEVNAVSMPETMVGTPVVTSDGGRIYYLTDQELRYLEVDSGLDKLLKQISFPEQTIQRLHFDDSALECYIVDEDRSEMMMISTKTGQLVYSTDQIPVLLSDGENYYATCYESGIEMYLFGTRGGTPSCLFPEGMVCLESVQMQGVVSSVETELAENQYQYDLFYYDLTSDTKASAVKLPEEYYPGYITDDPQDHGVWFLASDPEGKTALYHWDLSLSETGDTTSYVTPYYTAEEPDTQGLKQIAEQAKTLGQRFGVRILVYEDALNVEPSDYTFQAEHLVPVYRKYLKELEQMLAQYPEGFLKKVGTTSGNGKVTISLVRAAYGDNDLGSLDSADGVHFYNDGNVYIALVTADRFGPTLHHELFHSIDTYVLNHTNIYDDWEKLNPKGFQYDNDYVANQYRDDYEYLEGERWFIDMYSMSYPKEDRARIMEYAMEPGNAEYFESKHMQKKLATLCKGIRTAFGLNKYNGTLPWEQYLG